MRRKNWRLTCVGAGDPQPLLNVFLRLLGIERSKLSSEGNALFQLSQFDGVQLLVKFRLTRQDDLHQFVFRRLQVRKETEFFQCVRGQIVCLVDNHDTRQVIRAAVDKKLAEIQQKLALIFSRRWQAEIGKNILEKIRWREPAIEHIRVGNILAVLEEPQ